MTAKRFITAFIICALILVAALAMIRADLRTRQLSGNNDRALFSYERTIYNQGRLELFGIVYIIDLNTVEDIKVKLREMYTHNLNYIPDFILNTGKIFGNIVSNSFDNFV